MFSDETMIVYSAAKAAQRDLAQANNTIHWQNNRIANLIDDIDNGNATIRSLRRELEELQRSNEKLEKLRKKAQVEAVFKHKSLSFTVTVLVEFLQLALPNLGRFKRFAATQTKTHNGKTYEGVDYFFAEALDFLTKKDDELAQYLTENDLPAIDKSVWPWAADIETVLKQVEEIKMKGAKTEYTKTRLLIAEEERLAEEAEKKRLAEEAEKKRLAEEAEKKRKLEKAKRGRVSTSIQQEYNTIQHEYNVKGNDFSYVTIISDDEADKSEAD